MESKLAAKYRLGKITNKYHILEILSWSFYRQKSFPCLFQISKSYRQLLTGNYEASLLISEDALSHIEDLPSTITQVDLPDNITCHVQLVLISEDRIYTVDNQTLYVYSMSDFSSPIATQFVNDQCQEGIIYDKCLYLGGDGRLYVFEITKSNDQQPLTLVTKIKTLTLVTKI